MNESGTFRVSKRIVTAVINRIAAEFRQRGSSFSLAFSLIH